MSAWGPRPRPEGRTRAGVEWTSSDGCSMVVLYFTADDARELAHAFNHAPVSVDLLALADRCDVANGEKVGDEPAPDPCP